MYKSILIIAPFLLISCSSVLYAPFTPYSETTPINLNNVSNNVSVTRLPAEEKMIISPKIRSFEQDQENITDWYLQVELDKKSFKKKYSLQFNIKSELEKNFDFLTVSCSNNKGLKKKIRKKYDYKTNQVSYLNKYNISPGDVKRMALCKNGKVKISNSNSKKKHVEDFNLKFQTYFKEARFVYLKINKENLDQFLSAGGHNTRNIASRDRQY